MIREVLNEITLQSKYLTELDSAIGVTKNKKIWFKIIIRVFLSIFFEKDGDLGMNMEKAAKEVLKHLDSFALQNPGIAFYQLAMLLQIELGGTSGVLYTLFFLRTSQTFREKGFGSPQLWAEAFKKGMEGICELGNSKKGDRTMLDALIPALDAFESALKQGSKTSRFTHSSF